MSFWGLPAGQAVTLAPVVVCKAEPVHTADAIALSELTSNSTQLPLQIVLGVVMLKTGALATVMVTLALLLHCRLLSVVAMAWTSYLMLVPA